MKGILQRRHVNPLGGARESREVGALRRPWKRRRIWKRSLEELPGVWRVECRDSRQGNRRDLVGSRITRRVRTGSRPLQPAVDLSEPPTRQPGQIVAGGVHVLAFTERIGELLSPRARLDQHLACLTVNAVGKPDEGEPHVRFDVAGSGNQIALV